VFFEFFGDNPAHSADRDLGADPVLIISQPFIRVSLVH